MNKKLIAIIIVLLAVVAGGATLFLGKNSACFESAEKIDFVEAVNALYKRDGSFSALNTKYAGKVVEFSGDFTELRSTTGIEARLANIDKTNKFRATIEYNTKVQGWCDWAQKQADTIVYAICYLAPGQEKKLQELPIGTKVTMHGTLIKMATAMESHKNPPFEVLFKDCKVVRCNK